MIKSELVQIVAARNPHLYHRDVENIVNAVWMRSPMRWQREIASNCAASVLSPSRTVRRVRAQPAHGRYGVRGRKVGSLLQDGQGASRAPEPRSG